MSELGSGGRGGETGARGGDSGGARTPDSSASASGRMASFESAPGEHGRVEAQESATAYTAERPAPDVANGSYRQIAGAPTDVARPSPDAAAGTSRHEASGQQFAADGRDVAGEPGRDAASGQFVAERSTTDQPGTTQRSAVDTGSGRNPETSAQSAEGIVPHAPPSATTDSSAAGESPGDSVSHDSSRAAVTNSADDSLESGDFQGITGTDPRNSAQRDPQPGGAREQRYLGSRDGQLAANEVALQPRDQARVDESIGVLRPHEQATVARLAEDPGFAERTFSAPPPPDPGYDWHDDLGHHYDALGDGTKSQYFRLDQFKNSIDRHLLKSNDFTVVDMTGYTDQQVSDVREHVDQLPPESRAKIIRVGF